MEKNSGIIKETYGDYLKTIYELSLKHSPVSTSALAKQMQVTDASASVMIRRLSKDSYVVHVPYQGVTLTEEGEKIALSLLRRHRLWEVFLSKFLKIPLANVHQYAELLEHATDNSLEDYLAAFLKEPEKDPHGNPIPTKDGQVSQFSSCRLVDLLENQSAEILQFTDEDPDLLRYLHELGIKPGTHITVQKRIPYDNSILINADESNIHLGSKIASTLMVRAYST